MYVFIGLDEVPEGDWYCDDCLFNMEEKKSRKKKSKHKLTNSPSDGKDDDDNNIISYSQQNIYKNALLKIFDDT